MSLTLADTDTTLKISEQHEGEIILKLKEYTYALTIKLNIDQAIEIVHHLAKEFDLNIRQ